MVTPSLFILCRSRCTTSTSHIHTQTIHGSLIALHCTYIHEDLALLRHGHCGRLVYCWVLLCLYYCESIRSVVDDSVELSLSTPPHQHQHQQQHPPREITTCVPLHECLDRSVPKFW